MLRAFDFVLMLGDNIYGAQTADGFRRKFEDPYKPLLDAGVKFYASLGNHVVPMNGFTSPLIWMGADTTASAAATPNSMRSIAITWIPSN